MQVTPDQSTDGSAAPVDATATLPVGAAIGDYEIVREIGHGGMGAVYDVVHRELRTHYALKIFDVPPGPLADVLRQKFLAEARVMASFRHPNIVRVFQYGCFADSRRAYLVEDLVGVPIARAAAARADPAVLLHPAAPASGAAVPLPLADLVAAARPVPAALIVRIYEDLRSALVFCHAKGIVHSDIKAENVLMAGDGHALLSDFGIVRVLNPQVRADLRLDTLTLPGGAGTAYYLAPECVRGGQPTPASDVYAFGVLLFKLTTGIWYEKSPRLLDEATKFAPDWAPILRRMLDADPAARYASARDLPPPPVQSAARRPFPARHPFLVFAGLSVLTLSAAVGLRLGLRSRPAPAVPTERPPAPAALVESPAAVVITNSPVAIVNNINITEVRLYTGTNFPSQFAVASGSSLDISFDDLARLELPEFSLVGRASLTIRRPAGTSALFSNIEGDAFATNTLAGPALFSVRPRGSLGKWVRLRDGARLLLDKGDFSRAAQEVDVGPGCALEFACGTNTKLWNLVHDVTVAGGGELIIAGGKRQTEGNNEHWRLHGGARVSSSTSIISCGLVLQGLDGVSSADLHDLCLYSHGFCTDVRANAVLDLDVDFLCCYDFWSRGDFIKTGPGRLNLSGKELVAVCGVRVEEGTLNLVSNWVQDTVGYFGKGKQPGDWFVASNAVLSGSASVVCATGTTVRVQGTLAGNIRLSRAELAPGAVLRPAAGGLVVDDLRLPASSASSRVVLRQVDHVAGPLLRWSRCSGPLLFDARPLPGFAFRVTTNSIEALCQP